MAPCCFITTALLTHSSETWGSINFWEPEAATATASSLRPLPVQGPSWVLLDPLLGDASRIRVPPGFCTRAANQAEALAAIS